ncbi:unnamed protein product [Auanema sp. JU1783]|nr:unnamed protein product [Auanema sp. JU1783]
MNMEQQDVSITDANDDTLHSKVAPHSAMLDLIGDLQKKKKKEVKEVEKRSENKKEKEEKYKTVLKKDRFEPQNYLLRIEGSICCSTIIVTTILIVTNFLLLLTVITLSKGDLRHLVNTIPINQNDK